MIPLIENVKLTPLLKSLLLAGGKIAILGQPTRHHAYSRC